MFHKLRFTADVCYAGLKVRGVRYEVTPTPLSKCDVAWAVSVRDPDESLGTMVLAEYRNLCVRFQNIL